MLEAAILSIGMQMTCLAVTVYHEARGEGHAGMLGVALTVINRQRWRRPRDGLTLSARS